MPGNTIDPLRLLPAADNEARLRHPPTPRNGCLDGCRRGRRWHVRVKAASRVGKPI